MYIYIWYLIIQVSHNILGWSSSGIPLNNFDSSVLPASWSDQNASDDTDGNASDDSSERWLATQHGELLTRWVGSKESAFYLSSG